MKDAGARSHQSAQIQVTKTLDLKGNIRTALRTIPGLPAAVLELASVLVRNVDILGGTAVALGHLAEWPMSPVNSYVIPSPADDPDTRVARRTRRRMETFPARRIVSIDTHDFDEFNEWRRT